MFPLKASSNQRFSILRRRIMHAVACSDIDRSIILVFQSRAFLGLLADQFKHLNVIAACEGESEAITALRKQRVGLMVAGDQLKEGHITSLGTRATKIQPNLRMMAILQDPISSHRCTQFHALIADADIGVDEFPVYQGLMAMLTNTQYRSTGILELHELEGVLRDIEVRGERVPFRSIVTDGYLLGASTVALDELVVSTGSAPAER